LEPASHEAIDGAKEITMPRTRPTPKMFALLAIVFIALIAAYFLIGKPT